MNWLVQKGLTQDLLVRKTMNRQNVSLENNPKTKELRCIGVYRKLEGLKRCEATGL